MLSTLSSAVGAVRAAVAAALVAVLYLTGGGVLAVQAAPPRLTPTMRARVRQTLARRLGDGQAVTRAEVLAELYPPPPPAAPVAVPAPVGFSVALVPTQPRPVPAPRPDRAVSVSEAAGRLGYSEATIRRYLTPSSGKLVRLGDGVSLASVEALAGAR